MSKKQNGKLSRIVEMAKQLVASASRLEMLEKQCQQAREEKLRLEREDLPALMKECELSSITLEDGSTIRVVMDIDARISEANRPAAFHWLAEHGFGGLIKTLVSVPFERGDHEKALKAQRKLDREFGCAQLVESVHPATLKAFVKERMAASSPVPMDLFGVFPYEKATITKGK